MMNRREGCSLIVQESSIDNMHVSPSCHLDKLYLIELHDPKYEFFMFQQGKKVRKQEKQIKNIYN